MVGGSIRKLLVGWSLVLLTAVVTVLAPPPAPATAASWSSVALTANFTTNEQPDIAGAYVVWQAYDGVDWEILLYDLSTHATRQLTRDVIDQTDPRVEEDHALWVAHEPSGPVLVLYDLATGTSVRLPQSEGVEGSPEITGELVVWVGGESASAEVYLYDIESGDTTRLTNDGYEQLSPDTDGRYVVFETQKIPIGPGPSPAPPRTEVSLYDSQTKTLEVLADDSASGPHVSQGLVVWQEGRDKAAEIVLYNASTKAVARVTENSVEDVAPVVGGGKVAWLSWGRPDDFRVPHDSPWKAMLYDTATRKTTVVTDYSLSAQIQEDGQLLVWSYWEMGPVYEVYDIATGRGSPVSPYDLASFGAELDGGRVVWVSYPGFRLEDDRAVYLAAQDDLPPAAVPPTPPVREFADIDDSPYSEAIERLARLGIARGYRTPLPVWSVDIYELQYRPEEPTLRWQFLKMLLAIVGIDPRNHTNQPPFLDIQALDPTPEFNLRYYVEAGLENGIVRGISPLRFAPFSPLTRAQAVTMVVRAAKVVRPEALDWLVTPTLASPYDPAPFAGSLGNFSAVHAENMRVAEYNGLLEHIVGFGPGWDPWAPISRGEAAQILVNLADKL